MIAGLATALVLCGSAVAQAPAAGYMLPLERFHVDASGIADGMIEEALKHFEARVTALGAQPVSRSGDGDSIRVGVWKEGLWSGASLSPEKVKPQTEGWQDFQKRQGYFLALDETDGRTTLHATALSPLGVVFAVSELELRLRLKDGKAFLAFPEWTEGVERVLFDKPAIEGRGEYMNVGYNLQQITPHEWSQARWHEYIDKLVLAKLNRFYFYIWIDTYSMYPGSELSKRPINRAIHENIRDMIDYAHRRGLDVTYMYCPTYFPKDVWEAHPEWHADIEYVGHGFPAGCPSAPGSWDQMVEMARSEFEWFKAADAIQLWYYDPGGCWCEKYGCKPNQAKILARETKEFGDLFREYNPKGRVEFNYWPAWLWEELQKVKYREETGRLIREAFGAEAGEVTAVGAPDNDITQPLMERDLGFGTGIFLFSTNPERSYVFTLPQLEWLRDTNRQLRDRKFDAVFGHRLEAWTRYPQTFFMSQFLWNPDLTPEAVVGKFGGWQAADEALGARLGEALLMLDRFSRDGAEVELGARMDALMHEVYAELPEVSREEIEYLPPTTKALRIIAESKEETDPAKLEEYSKRFEAAMNESETMATWRRDARKVFDSYRTMVITGWLKERY